MHHAIPLLQVLHLLWLIHGFLLKLPLTTDSPCQSATRAPASSDLVLDTPPGFPLDVPHGFTKAHCLLHTGETAESYIDSSPSLVLDTPPGFPLDIPPGFSEAHRRLPTNTSDGSEAGVSIPGSEKKSLIEFSLNVTRPVQTVVLPGFTRLHSVKKDPGLPAVCKATEKIKPIGKVDEMKIKHEVQHCSHSSCFSNPIFSNDLYFISP